MPNSSNENMFPCCGITEEERCNDCSARNEAEGNIGINNRFSFTDEGRCQFPNADDNSSPTSVSTDENGHGDRVEMGCSCSADVKPAPLQSAQVGDSENPLQPGSPVFHSRIEKKDSTESSSGEEDVFAIDKAGRQTASDADLINAQRSEKTDVTCGLEDRWLRSHFSGTKAIAPLPATIDTSCSYADKTIGPGQVPCGIQTGDAVCEKAEYEGVTDLKVRSSQNSVTVSSNSQVSFGNEPPKNVARHLSILHFNDVYELTERKKDPVGGASRFSTLFQEVSKKAQSDCDGQKPFVAFGGDCLNPSILSSATKGMHMIEVLNHLQINAAVFGNHEFDFGVEHAAMCSGRMNFPWFLSNVQDKLNGRPLANGVVSQVMQWGEFKIGVVGLIEEEWLDTLATVDKCELLFENFVKRGRELACALKSDGVDLVIALTHMRWPNDIKLAQEVREIDIILGGHDHDYGVKLVNDCVIVKSGCDFHTFSRIDLYIKKDGFMDVSVTRYDVTKETDDNPEMKKIVERYMTALEKQLQQIIGKTKTDLNGRYKDVRSRETNLGNFVADIMRMTTRAEIVLINSGTFRSNAIHESGMFRIRDLMSILPIHDNVVVIEVTGQQLLEGLENAVSKYPRLEGRFPQISGFCFGFDPKAQPNHRVIRDSVLIRGQPLDLKRVYKLATKAYVARGKDGYECFSNCRLLNDPDSGPVLSTVIRNHISNVGQLMRHEETTGQKIRVIEGGKKIMSDTGDLHEVYSSCFYEDVAPVYQLQKSMEDVMPKDSNDNYVSDDCEANGLKKNSESDEIDGPREPLTPHRQHLLEICCDRLFDKSEKFSGRIEKCRRKAIEQHAENLKLLAERQQSFEEVRWQVCPLLEGRIFHCPQM